MSQTKTTNSAHVCDNYQDYAAGHCIATTTSTSGNEVNQLNTISSYTDYGVLLPYAFVGAILVISLVYFYKHFKKIS